MNEPEASHIDEFVNFDTPPDEGDFPKTDPNLAIQIPVVEQARNAFTTVLTDMIADLQLLRFAVARDRVGTVIPALSLMHGTVTAERDRQTITRYQLLLQKVCNVLQNLEDTRTLQNSGKLTDEQRKDVKKMLDWAQKDSIALQSQDQTGLPDEFDDFLTVLHRVLVPQFEASIKKRNPVIDGKLRVMQKLRSALHIKF